MSAVLSFLDWYDGFCEGMGKRPNDAQWNRIKERITALRVAHQADPQADVAAQPTGQLLPPTNLLTWRTHYAGWLAEKGVDLETAKAYAADYDDGDVGKDPRACARKDLAEMNGGGDGADDDETEQE
jgi:hypothetical protein